MNDNELARVVTRLLPADHIERLARKHSLFKRFHIVHIVPLERCLVLATLATPNESMSQWHRFLLTDASQLTGPAALFAQPDMYSTSAC